MKGGWKKREGFFLGKLTRRKELTSSSTSQLGVRGAARSLKTFQEKVKGTEFISRKAEKSRKRLSTEGEILFVGGIRTAIQNG